MAHQLFFAGDQGRWTPTPEFPNLMEPGAWYSYPPVEAGPPRPFNVTRLGRLPSFLLEEIFKHLRDLEETWDVMVQSRWSEGRRTLMRPVWRMKNISNLMATCRQLRMEALTYLATSTVHTSRAALTLPRLPQEICLHNVR